MGAEAVGSGDIGLERHGEGSCSAAPRLSPEERSWASALGFSITKEEIIIYLPFKVVGKDHKKGQRCSA